MKPALKQYFKGASPALSRQPSGLPHPAPGSASTRCQHSCAPAGLSSSCERTLSKISRSPLSLQQTPNLPSSLWWLARAGFLWVTPSLRLGFPPRLAPLGTVATTSAASLCAWSPASPETPQCALREPTDESCVGTALSPRCYLLPKCSGPRSLPVSNMPSHSSPTPNPSHQDLLAPRPPGWKH